MHTSVLIVGGGPTGLLASILLSKWDIPHVLVERRAETVQAPAAHVVNTRTMEIYRQAGLDVGALYALNTHPNARYVSWNSRLGRKPVGVFDMASNRDALMAQSMFSREHTTNISQHQLEAALKRHADRSAVADIRFGVEWVGFEGDDPTTSRVADGSGKVQLISATFVLAADGAGSPIASSLNIRKIGPDALATFLNLTCEVDLTQVAGEDSTLLYWLLEPRVQGTIIVHDPRKLAVYMRPIAVPFETPEAYDDARCDALLKEVFGSVPYRVRHKGIWKMTAQVAEQFRAGPVFLVGDAAHRFPPTGGLGLNTGVGDVHNLVWKLAAVLRGDLPEASAEALLDSYEAERRPVAQRNCDVSKHNNAKMGEVVRSLGLDPTKAGALAKVMHSRAVQVLPETLQVGLYQMLTASVRKALARAESDDEGPAIRDDVARAIANQREHFSSLGLDLGYVYRTGCVNETQAQQTTESDVSTYTEVVGAGARLPERELNGAGMLHDQLAYTSFTLLKGTGAEQHYEETYGLGTTAVDLASERVGEASLAESLGIPEAGWVLVRPDGHTMALGSN